MKAIQHIGRSDGERPMNVVRVSGRPDGVHPTNVNGPGFARKNHTNAALALLLFLWVTVTFAASPSLTLSPQEATVGDYLTVELRVPDQTPDQITWPAVADELGDFTVISVDTSSSRQAGKEGAAWIRWTVAAYDTGSFSTGELTLQVEGQEATLPEQQAHISSVIQDSDTTSINMRPLKAQEELPFTFLDFLKLAWPWALGIAFLVLLWYLIRRWQRKRQDPLAGVEVEKPLLPPYDEAIVALRRLKKDNPLAAGDQKTYVSVLAEVMKRLLERVHGDPVLEMTTWEVKRWSSLNTLQGSKHHFLAILEEADAIKFAKGVLTPERADEMYEQTNRFVEAYKPAPEEENSGHGRKKPDTEASAGEEGRQ